MGRERPKPPEYSEKRLHSVHGRRSLIDDILEDTQGHPEGSDRADQTQNPATRLRAASTEGVPDSENQLIEPAMRTRGVSKREA